MAADPALSPRPRVLVIDDNVLLGRQLGACLSLTYEVQVADGAAAGRRTLASLNCDAVVCDVCMPEESGLDLYTTMPADTQAHWAFMTGGVLDPALAQRLTRVTCPVLFKPFQLGAVERLVAQLVSGQDCTHPSCRRSHRRDTR
ncbi:MAG: response regulator [Myxococcales bacterium]|nr:response regulator [Myxococcales bacterium]